MQYGVVFPSTEIAGDPAVIRDFAQMIEDLGYAHLLMFDHVLGANKESRPGWSGFYDHTDKFHEPFILMGWLAALTSKIELVTGIVILPQRQTPLVAKQAAEIDVLSGGRLRLGIGIGWNDVEYQALGENFRNRGRRMEEQIDLLRKLWANEVIDYDGEWHSISDMGLNPLPGNRSIPLWGGAFAPPAIERVCRLLDGWFPRMPLDEKTEQRMDRAWGFLEAAGKKREDFGIDATIYAATDDVDQWLREAERWQSLGATHICFQTIGQGRTDWASHLEAIRKFKEAIGQ